MHKKDDMIEFESSTEIHAILMMLQGGARAHTFLPIVFCNPFVPSLLVQTVPDKIHSGISY